MIARRWLTICCLCLASCAPSGPTGQPPGDAKQDSPSVEYEPVIEVSPRSLFEAYAENGGEGGKQYTGHMVKIEGVVKDITAEDGKPCLMLYVPARDGGAVIRCAFEPAREPDMADVKPGGNVTIRGRCLGPVNRSITIDQCTVLRYRAPKN